MMKKIFTLILLILTISTYGQSLNWIPFRWEGEELDGKYIPKVSISVPVKIDNLACNFKMQLDLGAVNTVIYGESIKNYLQQYPRLKNRIDTSLTCYIENEKNFMFRDIDLKLGTLSFGKKNIGYFKSFGSEIQRDSINTLSEKMIGTIAPDLFQGKILIIDYPHQRIGVADKLPTAFASAAFERYKAENGRIKIPLNINGQLRYLLFDTGSSLFALLTTDNEAKQIAEKALADSIKTSTWGEHYYVYGKKINVPVKFGNKTLEPSPVYFDNKNRFGNFYRQQQIWGITGNAYFLNNVIIIDYKNQLFGVY